VAVRVHLLGVRGSTPTPGRAFARHGGHTSCIAVEVDDGRVPLVVDAGTGLRSLGALLGGEPFRGTLLLGHLHWDHTHGLPFSTVVDHPGSRIRLFAPVEPGQTVDGMLEHAMSPPNFPIGPRDLRGDWSWEPLVEGEMAVDELTVLARQIPHKGGRTFGFRIDDGRHSFAYLSDHMPQSLGPGPDALGERHDAALALADGVDVLIHDAQYTAEELPSRGDFGHSCAEYAVALGEAAGASRVVLFHHDPGRTDAEVDAIVARFADSALPVRAAVEGTAIDL
jgi:phosphoribosyl 1,2-cyclic phosphodiesterase